MKRRLHVISNTHWDREWRYSLWRNRHMLVELIDSLIDLMEQHPEYRHYILDGQSVVVQDYLQFRPEKYDRLKKLINKGRIQVGPWYTLPHEYGVSGESLVRNLLIGMTMAQAYGQVCKIGYTVFSFGQISQLPQIYAGFGIDKIMVCKRVSKTRAPNSEFLWESPDGTRALTTRFGDHGRGNYFYSVFIPALFGKSIWKGTQLNPAWHYLYDMGGRPCHLIDNDSNYQDTFLLDSPHGWYPELIPQGIKDCKYTVRESTVTSPKLFSESADFCNPTLHTIHIINEGNKSLVEAELIHSNINDYMDELAKAVDNSKLAVVRGELRDGPGQAVQASIHSTGIPIRLKNFKAETNLILVTEPLLFMTASLGYEYPRLMIDKAWEYLLKAHPHDSITGLGDKSIWSNTLYRLDQVLDISDTLITHAIQQIVRHIDSPDEPADTIFFTAFNTLVHNRNADTEINLDLPSDTQPGFEILDDNGKIIPYQILHQILKNNAVVSGINRPLPYKATRIKIRLNLTDLPALGYKTFKLKYNRLPQSCNEYGVKTIDSGSMFTSHNTMENNHLIVKVNGNGTLDITRKVSGHTYHNFLYFEDRGNIGLCHFRQYPLNDEVCTNLSVPADISAVEEGPLCCAMKVVTAISVPANTDRTGRNGIKTTIDLEYKIRLTKYSEFVEVDLHVDNNARNHILRMIFPSNLKTNQTHADTPFDIDTRVLASRSENSPVDWTMDEQPCLSFVDVNDGKEGFAIFTGGLANYEMLYRTDRPLCIAVLRAHEAIVDSGEAVLNHYPDWDHAQSLGKHSFRFAIYPHGESWDSACVAAKAAMFHTPVKIAQHGKGTGNLPYHQSWLSVEPCFIHCSAIKKAHSSESFILRLFNPTQNATEVNVKLAENYKEAWICDMGESRKQQLCNGSCITTELSAKKIVTIELVK